MPLLQERRIMKSKIVYLVADDNPQDWGGCLPIKTFISKRKAKYFMSKTKKKDEFLHQHINIIAIRMDTTK